MKPPFPDAGFDLWPVLAIGGIGLVLLWSIQALLELIPLGRTQRDLVGRIGPVVWALGVGAFVLYAASSIVADYPAYVPIVVASIIFVIVLAAWTAIRDFVSGVFLKAGRVCRVGDYVRVGDIQGRVERMGARVMNIETTSGDEAVIPYGVVLRSSLLRTPVIDSVALHVFQVSLPSGMSRLQAKTTIRETALASHWSALIREPEIAFKDGVFEVTVFALDADHGSEVEVQVRQALQPRSASLPAPAMPRSVPPLDRTTKPRAPEGWPESEGSASLKPPIETSRSSNAPR